MHHKKYSNVLFMKKSLQSIYSTLFFTVAFMLFGCNQSSDRLFSKVSSSSTHINFKNILVEDENFNVLNYPYFYNGGGVAIGDINNDGYTDYAFTIFSQTSTILNVNAPSLAFAFGNSSWAHGHCALHISQFSQSTDT